MTDERTQMRRKDRGRGDKWIREYLTRAAYGFLSTVREGQPFVNINTFIYDPETNSIYMHTAGTGRLRSNTESETPACFALGEIGKMLPARKAKNLSAEFAGVVVFGKLSVVTDQEFARAKMRLLNEKYFPRLQYGVDYEPISQAEIEEVTVYRFQIETWSGKMKIGGEDAIGVSEFPHWSAIEAHRE